MNQNLLAIVGYLIQFLRAIPRFSDWWIAPIVTVTALIGVLQSPESFAVLNDAVVSKGFFNSLRAWSFVLNEIATCALIIMGGLGTAIMGANLPTQLAPKHNQFGGPDADPKVK